jgi:serine/threonine-protein kinase
MHTRDFRLVADRYMLETQLQPNGPVELYYALDKQLQRAVLLQILSEEAAADEALCLRFRRHQQLAATIHHPSVLAVYDAGEWRGRPYSVLEKNTGKPAVSLYRGDDRPPDVRQAIKVACQTAEALQFCRSAGLADWPFSYRAVQVDEEGNARLALLGGLDLAQDAEQGYVSNRPSDDPQALAALMLAMLAGNPDPNSEAAKRIVRQIPASVADLLARMTPGGANRLTTAGEVANALSELEGLFEAPTEAYTPAEGNVSQNAALPHLDPSQQPTVAAGIVPGATFSPYDSDPSSPLLSDTAPMAVRPRTVVPDTAPMPVLAAQQRRSVRHEHEGLELWRLAPVLGLVLVALLLLLVVLPRFLSRPAPVEGATQVSTPTPAASAPVATVPDLRGHPLDEAAALAQSAGLQVEQGEPVHHPTYPPDTVAGQIPDPGTQVATGSVITVSLSLGPEPPPAVEQQPPPQHAEPKPAERGKKQGEKKGKKDKEGDD